MRILVVDDEPQITRVLRASLVSSGYEVLLARDGVEGFDSYRESAPDLVITDVSMPRMDGIELTRAIRQTSDTPIIVLSVREQDTMKVAALDEGADDYVTKPFSKQHSVRVRQEEVHLTPKEFTLLLVFARNPSRVLTHRRLLKAVWGAAGQEQPGEIRVLVSQLRRKIEATAEPRYILNEPWVGYRFDPGQNVLELPDLTTS